MDFINRRWIVCVLCLLLIQFSAISAPYKILYQDDHFLLEGIFQVLATDIDEDRQAELLVAGKNYTGREQFIYALKVGAGFKPMLKWRSDNLFEERSVLWTAQGNFDGMGLQLLALTRGRLNLYQFAPEAIKIIQQFPNETEVLGLTSTDVDGDHVLETIVVRVGKVTPKSYNCVVEIRKLVGKQWTKVFQSGLLGNIRGIAAGDLDGDGKAEIVIEEGLKLDTGTIHLYAYNEGRLVEKNQIKLVNNGAIYALKIREFPEGNRLLTASTKGKVNCLALAGGKLTAVCPEQTLKYSLVDIEAADLNNDTKPELVLAGYPNTLLILGQ